MISSYDFKYKGLMKSSMDSIPLGNGDLGANIWASGNEINILLSKTDAFSRLHRLLKTGYIKLRFQDGVLNENLDFHLVLEEGILKISNENIRAEIYADAFEPVYITEIEGKGVSGMALEVINYRSRREKIAHNDRSNYQLNCESNEDTGFDCTEDADILFSEGDGTLGQMHQNSTSLYEFSLSHQHLENYPEKNDFLTGLTFGFLAKSEEMTTRGNTLTVKDGAEKVTVSIHSLTLTDGDEWREKIKSFPKSDKEKHKAYWKSVWGKSYVYISGGKDADKITQGYALQRYMNLCGGKGRFPVKFNGSIFTCQPSPHSESENYDYRNWGGYYWFQNTRLIYWSMLFSGDYDLMMPFFRLYTDNLDFAKYRTQKYFGHGGAFYPETMSIFAAYADSNYGWDRKDLPDGTTLNTYIRYYYSGGLEAAMMMLLYCRNTEDTDFLKNHCLPFVKEILLFFREHFTKEDGSICFEPTSSLETWHNCINDSPDIAGVTAVCEFLLAIGTDDEELKAMCAEIQAALPPLPIGKRRIKRVVMPFEKNIERTKMNCENPELYTVFPYAIYKIGNPDLKIGINTFKARREKASCGWQQHGVQAAFLGLRKEAFREILKNCKNTNKDCIFPVFYGPNYDWLPDQDNGANMNMAIAKSLVQENDEKIFLLPAWDKSMDVSFRLPVGKNNFITVVYKKGESPEYSFDKPEKREIVLC
ncbi:MAG: DUF5703 domain-containing protein [Candidatus Fimenecus sp.]